MSVPCKLAIANVLEEHRTMGEPAADQHSEHPSGSNEAKDCGTLSVMVRIMRLTWIDRESTRQRKRPLREATWDQRLRYVKL